MPPKQIPAYYRATSVLPHTFYQWVYTVWIQPLIGKNAVTTQGAPAVGTRVPFFFKVCCLLDTFTARFKQMARPAVAIGCARISNNVDCDLPLPVSGLLTGSNRGTTGKSNPMAS